MAFEVEVAGYNSWWHNGRIYKQGVHVTEDATVVEAAKRARNGMGHGQRYGVFVRGTNDTLTEPDKTFHRYTLPPLHGAVEVEPGVFEPKDGVKEPPDDSDAPVDKPAKKVKIESPAK